LIIRGGENISPGQVEEAFLSHPEVRDCQCIGVEDDYFGEEVAVWINARDFTADCPQKLKDDLLAKLLDFTKDKLAHYN
jgi:fatty-acyl-CoA synthase